MNSVETAPPTFWVGESGVRSSGYGSSSASSSRIRASKSASDERRGVEHVVAPPRVVDLLGQLPVLLTQVGEGVLRGRVVT